MGLVDLIKYKPLYSIFILLSLRLYFNENIAFSQIKKKWITIKENKLIWNHRFAELKHVINNIKLTKMQLNKPSKCIYYEKELIDLNYYNKDKNTKKKISTKYEKFTSEIVNNIIKADKMKKDNIKKIRVLHCKNIRNNSQIDLPLVSLQVIDKTETQDVYKLSESKELLDLSDIFLNFDKSIKIITFTDWRDLYRNGYSLSHAEFLFLNDYIKMLINKLNVHIFSITMTKDKMYAMDLVNILDPTSDILD